MCDKSSYRDAKELIDKMNNREWEMVSEHYKAEPPKPKTAYELLMEKQKRLKECDTTMWFTDEKCEECGKDVFTDGRIFYCKEMCINHGKRGAMDKEGFGFINDLIR